MNYRRTLILTSLFLVLPLSGAEAQENDAYIKSNALWFNSSNAAGLAAEPFAGFKTASIRYAGENGTYHLMQQGQNTNDIIFNTEGVVKVGKVQLWGQFDYNNITDNGTRYNTIQYDPFDERFLYSVADTTSSQLKKQSYDMQFKAAVPVVEDRLFAGLHMRYSDKIFAKQNDPRAETYQYFVTLSPSLVYRMDRSSLGFDLRYTNLYQRVSNTISNTDLPQIVSLTRGLGNRTEDLVGGNVNMSVLYYKSNSYGGSLQWHYQSPVEILLEAGADLHVTEAFRTPSLPRAIGRTDVLDLTFKGQIKIDGEALQIITVDAAMRSTDGTEYATVQEKGIGWIIASESIMSRYSAITATAAYDYYIKDGDSYKWDFHAGAAFRMKDDIYYSPAAAFNYNAVMADLGVKRYFLLNKSSLLAGIDAAARKGLSGEYVFGGSKNDNRLATEWYPHDLDILTSDYILAGANAEWMFPVNEKLHLGCTASVSGLFATGSRSRLFTDLGIKLAF